ncbi:MAG: UDP-N-acetylglucosamine diphosphorylase [Simkania sp.]|nr:UDP-N-acetylglucosamine diphosphorylase [Simkania sp.]
MLFHPQDFFDLSVCEHKVLFERSAVVWDALKNLKEYLDGLPIPSSLPTIPKGVYLENSERIVIGQGVIIEPGAYIKGPCWIGEGSIIRHGAYVRDYALIGKRCVIGHATEIKHSILLDQAHAAHFNYVGDSILGNYVNLGAGSKCANLRFDKAAITVRWEGKTWETGLKKLGTILGDRSQLGCNVVSNPGTVVLPNIVCAPCLNIGGMVTSSLTKKH